MSIDRNKLSEYAASSRVHGVAEITHYRSWARLLWLILISICLPSMCYNVWSILADLRGEPIVTYVKNFDKHYNFPTLMLCPPHFKYNRSSYLRDIRRSYNESDFKDVWGYVHEHLNRYWTSLESLSYTKAVIIQPTLDQEQWKRVATRVWENMIGDESYTDMELGYLSEFDKLIIENKDSPIKNKRVMMSTLGGCYVFEFETKIVRTFEKMNQVSFSIRRNRAETYWDYRARWHYFSNGDNLFLGAPSFWPKANLITIPQLEQEVPAEKEEEGAKWDKVQNRYVKSIFREPTITAFVTSIEFNRLNLRRRPCRNWSSHDRSICMVDCFNEEFCSKMERPCLIFHPNQTREEQYKKLCCWVEGGLIYMEGTADHCLYREDVYNGGPYDLYCGQKCPILCHEETYSFTREIAEEKVYQPGNRPSSSTDLWANVTLRFQDPMRRLKIEEKEALTSYEFAAEIGSALALWIGLSGLAFAQTIVFLLRIIFNCTE